MKAFKELLFLSKLNGVGPVRINKFYLQYLKQNIEFDELCKIVLENEKKVDSSNVLTAIEYSNSTYKMIENRKDVIVLTVLDDEYPKKLKDLENNAPVIVYVKGDTAVLNCKSIAVIGTREPSEWSIKVESRLVKKILDESDYVITSGLALGCDAIGHRECLKNGGKTIAVLPCGFDSISPATNRGLSEDIVKKGGALITEYLPDEESTRYTFVKRDTLIAAISDAILVIECGLNSGTMHAVNDGKKLKRVIGAYLTDLKNKGNYEGNELIVSDESGTSIKDIEDFQEFLKLVEKKRKTSVTNQISLFDILGG